jgi:choline O-acetyltransferase
LKLKFNYINLKSNKVRTNKQKAYDMWLDDMYMLNKMALPINSNPGMIFPPETFQNEDAYLRFTARLISGIMDYKLIVDAQILPVDRCTCREKGQPLCMEQYYRLFSTYRLPGVTKDVQINYEDNNSLEHCIVMSRNQIFKLDVVTNNGRLSEDDLYQQLKRIRRQSEAEQNTNNAFADIGYLTSLPRDQWALARQELIKGIHLIIILIEPT